MAQVTFRFLGDTGQIRRSFGIVGSGLRGIGDDADKASRRLSFAGRNLQRTLGPPIAAGIGLAVREFSRFDDALTGSISIMGSAGDALRTQLADGALEVARTTRTSATEAAGAYEFLALAGFTAEQSLAALPIVARTAQAAGSDLQLTTDLLTDSLSALGLASDDARERQANLGRISDSLAGISIRANANIVQLGEALTNKAGAALRTFGKDVEEGAAVLGVFADQGTKGRIAGERLNILLVGLSNAATRNADAFSELGVQVFDNDGTFRNIADVVDDLTGALGGMSDEQRTAALASLGLTEQAGAATLQLLGMGDRLRELETAARNSGGTVEDLADRQMQSLAAQFDVAKNEAQAAAIELGGAFAPAASSAASVVADLAGGLANLGPTGTTAVVALAGIGLAAGPAVRLVGGLVGGLNRVAQAGRAVRTMEALGGSMGVLGRTTAIAGTAASGLLASLGPIAIAATGVFLAVKAVDAINQRAADSFDNHSEAAQNLAETHGNVGRALVATAEGDFQEASRLTQEFATANANAIDQLQQLDDAASRERFLVQVGYELVQDGQTPEQAFAAIATLASEAGIELPVDITVGDLTDVELRLTNLFADAQDLGSDLGNSFAPLTNLNQEVLRGVAESAAQLADAGDFAGAAAEIAAFEEGLRESGATASQQASALNFLTDEFGKFIESFEGFDLGNALQGGATDLTSLLEQIADGATTASFETEALARAALDLADGEAVTIPILEEAARVAEDLATGRQEAATAAMREQGAVEGATQATGAHAEASGADAEATAAAAEAHDVAAEAVRNETAARREAIDPVFAVLSAEQDLAAALAAQNEATDEEGRTRAREQARDATIRLLGAQEDVARVQSEGRDVVGETEGLIQEATDRGIEFGDAFDGVLDNARRINNEIDQFARRGTIDLDFRANVRGLPPSVSNPPSSPVLPGADRQAVDRPINAQSVDGGSSRVQQNFVFNGPVNEQVTGEAAAFGVRVARGG